MTHARYHHDLSNLPLNVQYHAYGVWDRFEFVPAWKIVDEPYILGGEVWDRDGHVVVVVVVWDAADVVQALAVGEDVFYHFGV